MSQRQPFNTARWIGRMRTAWRRRLARSARTLAADLGRSQHDPIRSAHGRTPLADGIRPDDGPRPVSPTDPDTGPRPVFPADPADVTVAANAWDRASDHASDHGSGSESPGSPRQSADSWQAVLSDTWHRTWNDWIRRLTEMVIFTAGASYFLLDRWVALRVAELPGDLVGMVNELTDWAKSTMWLVGSAIIALAGVAMNRWKLAMRSAYFFAAIALAGILVNIIKPILARYRPKGWLEHDWWGLSWFDVGYVVNSMPSGHSSTAGALGGALFCLFPKLWPVWLVGALGLGTTRVLNNAHWVSDVILGLYLGFMTALLLKTLWQRLGWWDPKPRNAAAASAWHR